MRARLVRVVAPARWALRAHWGTAVLLGITGACALGALLPVSALFHGGPLTSSARLLAPEVRTPDLLLPLGPYATTTAAFRSATTATLFSVLTLIAAGVFLVAAITLFAIADVRGAARSGEMVVRRAVGASRLLLLLAAGFETAIIVAAVFAAGGVTGVTAARMAGARWPGELLAGTVWVSVVVCSALLLLLCLGGALPAVKERRRMPLGGRKGRALELVLPAVQLGVSLAVLGSAALLVRHAARLEQGAGGGSGAGIVFSVTAPAGPAAERANAFASLLERLRSDGFGSVSLMSPGAGLGLGIGDGILADCGQCRWGGIYVPFRLPFVMHYLASADTFRMLGLRLLAGRGLTDRDNLDTPRVAVVSASLAAENFKDGRAVGRRIQVGHGLNDWYTVVGVVANQVPAGYGGGLEPSDALYLSVLQHPARAVDLLVRAPHDSSRIAEIPGTIRALLGSDTAVSQEREERLRAREVAPVRWFGVFYGTEGWIILAVATLGTFAVMWLWVASLVHDLAVRRAVGARRRHIYGFVLGRAMGVAAAGVGFGLWSGAAVWSTLESIIAGLPPWEPTVVLRYSLLLVAAALGGALLPAWRVAHSAPAVLVGHGES